jgi:hypothetical protein
MDANGTVVFDPSQKPSFIGPATNPGQGVGVQAVGNLVGWDPNNPNLGALTAIPDPAGMRDPYVYSFFFGIQQEITPNTMLEVNYVGSAGHKLFRAADFNNARGGRLPIPGMCLEVQGETVCSNRDTTINPVTGNFVNAPGSVNPNYGSLRVWENAVNSSYNSLQVSATHRGKRGLTLAAHYTWGHSIDESSDWGAGGGVSINGFAAGDAYNLDVAHPELDRGNSTFDFRHRLVLSEVWELPWRQDQRGLFGHFLGGWQFNSIWSLQSGAHWTAFQNGPRDLRCSGGSEEGASANSAGGASACLDGGGEIVNVGGDFNLNGITNDRPDPVGSNTIHATKEQWIHGFFDGEDAYAGGFVKAPCLGCNGSLGRNTLVGPGLFQMDFSVFKKIPIKERLALQFRAEFFNAFNHANFRPPAYGANRVDYPLFGQATGTFDPREIQLALKMTW